MHTLFAIPSWYHPVKAMLTLIILAVYSFDRQCKAGEWQNIRRSEPSPSPWISFFVDRHGV